MGTTQNVYVRAKIDPALKAGATSVLAAMGLSVSDGIRLFMRRVAEERRLPFEVGTPNEETLKAMAEIEAREGKRFSSVDELLADLHADD